MTFTRLFGQGAWLAVFAAATLTGCSRETVREYRVAKEPKQSSGVAAVPQGWETAPPGEMRVASFKVRGQGSQAAEVSVIPLPGLAGHDLDNVNRWRGQVSQPTITETEMQKLAQPVEIAGETAQLYEQAGPTTGSGEQTRILAAILRRDGVAWFFKMTGDDALVAQQKPAFVSYLKSFSFPDSSDQSGSVPELPPSHPPIGNVSSVAAHSDSGENKPDWQVPTGWQETSGGPFLVAKFMIGGAGKAQAAVNVSMSAGDGGGLVGNVNRWRTQLGLKELPETEVNKLARSVDITDGKAMLVDMAGSDAKSGQKARLVGVIVSRAKQTWFYKLMGSDEIVTAQRDAFLKFVQTVKYSS